METRITAAPIYESPDRKPLFASDPPLGCVIARRYYEGRKEYKIGQPWSKLSLGQSIEVEMTNHYIWHGTIEALIDQDTLWLRPDGPQVAMPLPPVVPGKPYILPYERGDAWSVSRNPARF